MGSEASLLPVGQSAGELVSGLCRSPSGGFTSPMSAALLLAVADCQCQLMVCPSLHITEYPPPTAYPSILPLALGRSLHTAEQRQRLPQPSVDRYTASPGASKWPGIPACPARPMERAGSVPVACSQPASSSFVVFITVRHHHHQNSGDKSTGFAHIASVRTHVECGSDGRSVTHLLTVMSVIHTHTSP